MGSEPPYDELLRCLESDWNIRASWDGLRKFWCVELTEEGVKLRDAARAERTCEWTLKERWPNRTGDDHVYGYETGCGARHTWWPDSLPNFCPTCGGKVKVVGA